MKYGQALRVLQKRRDMTAHAQDFVKYKLLKHQLKCSSANVAREMLSAECRRVTGYAEMQMETLDRAVTTCAPAFSHLESVASACCALAAFLLANKTALIKLAKKIDKHEGMLDEMAQRAALASVPGTHPRVSPLGNVTGRFDELLDRLHHAYTATLLDRCAVATRNLLALRWQLAMTPIRSTPDAAVCGRAEGGGRPSPLKRHIAASSDASPLPKSARCRDTTMDAVQAAMEVRAKVQRRTAPSGLRHVRGDLSERQGSPLAPAGCLPRHSAGGPDQRAATAAAVAMLPASLTQAYAAENRFRGNDAFSVRSDLSSSLGSSLEGSPKTPPVEAGGWLPRSGPATPQSVLTELPPAVRRLAIVHALH